MTIKRLPTGYWLAWWNQNLWVQWPINRVPTLADAFGWVTERMVEQARIAADAVQVAEAHAAKENNDGT